MCIGAAVGVTAGYIGDAAGSGAEGSPGFLWWAQKPFLFYPHVAIEDFEAAWWGLSGAVVGAALLRLRQIITD